MLTEKSTFPAFLEAAKGKKVIGFGASTYMTDILSLLSSHNLQIEYIVDNDMWKWGGEHCGVAVCSPGKLYDEKPDEIIVLICIAYPFDIEKQLNNMEVAADYYAYALWTSLIYSRMGRVPVIYF